MPLRPATDDDLPRITALLRQSALPVDDLADATVHFLVEDDDMELAGVIGLQRFDGVALLRSLAVAPAHRRGGLGGRLVAALEARARDLGITELVLLTQTAEAFFLRNDYQRIRRDDAPAAVQASAEFRTLCPASAVCMAKRLP